MLGNEQPILPTLDVTIHLTLYLLMRVPATEEHHIVYAHGQLEGSGHFEKHFLSGESGAYSSYNYLWNLLILLTRYSILPAISLDGILHVDIIEGSFTSATFKDFIRGLLNHMGNVGEPNSIIVMDNCRIHKDPEILDMIRDQYVTQLVDALYS